MQNNTFSGSIVGQNIVVLQRVDSTNTYLRNELAKSAPPPEGTVIMAEEQYAGRGQAGNIWLSKPGKNLICSILLNPQFIKPENQFQLNIAVSLAINDVLKEIIGKKVKIKWPNDIYYGDNKLGGVLIENVLQGNTWKNAIIGIGLNVNQAEFLPELKNVTSLLKISGTSFNITNLLQKICTAIENRYLRLRHHTDYQTKEYEKALYRVNEQHRFRIGDTMQSGIITGVDSFGRILISIDGELKHFGQKEVSFVI